MRQFPEFRYMVWAKAHRSAPYHLASSGLSAPPLALAGLDRPFDDALLHRGADMPPEARRLVAARFGVEDEHVMLTLGTSHAMYLVCGSTLEPGDRCLVERPAYEVLATLPTLFGATVERFERRLEDGWRLPADLPSRIRSLRPALVVLTNPHNPTGAFLPLDDLAPVAAAAAEAGAVLAVDEVYLEYTEAPERHGAHRLGSHVVTASSLTKAYGLGTARTGWLLGAPERVEAAVRYNDYVAVLFPNPGAWVMVQALRHLPQLRERMQAVRARGLDVARAWVQSRGDVRWHLPDAGVIGFPRLERLSDATGFCEKLLADRGTLVVPGAFFEAPAHVRLGFGAEPDVLREGLARLGAALDELR
jgi:aspartate/methionine/tyrosine aminotransferase